MTRRHVTDFSRWPSLSLEGNLIAPAMLSKISAHDAPEQSPEDYSVRKGLTLREEISTAFRVGQSHYKDFADLDTPSQANTMRFAHAFLAETFAFSGTTANDGRASLIFDNRVPVVVVPPADSLDQRSQFFSSERARSPSLALQDHLSNPENGTWGLATNGNSIRLMRENASMTRPAFIEANIEQMFLNEDISSFSTLWLTIHRSRFGRASRPVAECTLETWRNAGAAEGEVVRDRLSGQVKEVLKVLGSGFLEANPHVSEQLKSGELEVIDWFNELLRLVYRLIFIMVAEDRNLLHSENTKSGAIELYEDGYSLKHLRRKCIRRSSWNSHLDIYEGLKIVFRSLSDGEIRLGLSALGGLFEKDGLPVTGTAHLPNHAIMKAIYKLSWLPDKKYGIAPINWRAMETEELGSVYESLLELQPQLSDDGLSLRFASDSVGAQGNQRKTTGSYYTPDSLVQQLLDTTLDPVLDSIENSCKNPAEEMLDISVIDPACGSGHFLLGATRRIAARVAQLRDDGNPSPSDYRNALRDVARRCIFGVDINPMAVELAKVALWIETVSPGFPLGFLDAQIRCGNSYLGLFSLDALETGIPAIAYKPLTEDLESVCKYYKNINNDTITGQGRLDFVHGGGAMPAVKPMSRKLANFRAMAEDSISEINTKAKKLVEIEESDLFVQITNASNLYISAFLMQKDHDPNICPIEHKVPTTEDVWKAVGDRKVGSSLAKSLTMAKNAGAFHWPVIFSDIMERGGFDVVIGNPPWEKIKLEEIQYFAASYPEIANAPNADARKRIIKRLRNSNSASERRLYKNFVKAKRFSEAISEFVRVPKKQFGRFPYSGRGDVNTYLLFAELFLQLVSMNGRGGIISPTGIATDATSAPFFSWAVSNNRLVSLFDFENRMRIFPDIDIRTKFSLSTFGKNEKRPRFAFFLTDPSDILESERNFTLTAKQIASINPNTNTAPIFRSQKDAKLAAKIFSNVPVLLNRAQGQTGDPWGVRFVSMFHMANDSKYFRTKKDLEGDEYDFVGECWMKNGNRFVPLFEAKMMHQFDHRYGDAKTLTRRPKNTPWPRFDKTLSNLKDRETTPWYWVEESEFTNRKLRRTDKDYWIVFRSITNATNERTVIASALPSVALSGKLPALTTEQSTAKDAALLGCLNSLVVDYCARVKVGGTDLALHYVKQFPILPPCYFTESRLAFVVPRVVELTYTSYSLEPFARELGFALSPFDWDDIRRAELRADLDAFFARAYGLDREDLRYIIDPADVMGDDYPSETFRGLKRNEMKDFGEFRTERLVLAAWDRMESGGEFAKMDM